jgi:hypothetical protein
MPWLFANATRQVFRCEDGTIALVWWDGFTTHETFECLEHGVRSCRHVREMRAAPRPDASVPTRADPRMFEREEPAPTGERRRPAAAGAIGGPEPVEVAPPTARPMLSSSA